MPEPIVDPTTPPEGEPKKDDKSITLTPQQLAERLARAKPADYDDLKAKAAKLDEIESANKSELEKAQATIAELQGKVTGFETKEQVADWAKEITKDSKVPADALRGSTREELEAHFKQLAALIPTDTKTPSALERLGIKPTPAAPASTTAEQARARATALLRGGNS